MAGYRRIQVFGATLYFEREYATDDPEGSGGLTEAKARRSGDGAYVVDVYPKYPLAQYICIPEERFQELYREAREAMKRLRGRAPRRSEVIRALSEYLTEKYEELLRR